MYEPTRQVLNFRHIEQINYLTFNFRELSRRVTLLLGVVPSPIIGQLRSLNNRIVENIENLEVDLARNERSPFEAKLEFYRQEYQEMSVLFTELTAILNDATAA